MLQFKIYSNNRDDTLNKQEHVRILTNDMFAFAGHQKNRVLHVAPACYCQ
jgi:hypothetical protein